MFSIEELGELPTNNEFRNVTEFVCGLKPNLLRIGEIKEKIFYMD